MVISFMIDNEILYQEAKDKVTKPSEEEVKLKYEEIESLINNNIKYEKEMKKVDLDKEFLLKQVYKDIIIQSYRDNFEKNLKISDEEIKDYYEKNKPKFNIKEIEASHILISTLDNDNKEVDISKKEELKKKAESIQEQAKSGQNFEELAKIYSDDKSTGQYGGKLGFFSKNDKNIEFTNEAFKLEKGDVSKVIETSYGYHIIKVTNKRDIQEGPEENKDIIKKQILNEKYINHIIELNKNADIKNVV